MPDETPDLTSISPTEGESKSFQALGPKGEFAGNGPSHSKRMPEPKNDNSLMSNIVENIKVLAVAFFICIVVKGTVAEARFIPSSSMEPTLKINDRLLVDKIFDKLTRRPITRGDILVFYPPADETGIPDDDSILRKIARLIPFVPESPPAFIKRVVGLPGDRIEIKSGVGVFINGKLHPESYIAEPPAYNLTKMGDFGGISMVGQIIHPYGNSEAPIIVPPDHVLMLGDNRNNSSDGHVWGFLNDDRIVGRACLTFWKSDWLNALHPNASH